MRAEALEEIVVLMLNKEWMLGGNAVKQKEILFSFQRACLRSLKKKLENCRQEQKQIFAQKDNLYEQYALKTISGGEYQKRSNELTERLSALSVKESDAVRGLEVSESEYRTAGADIKQMIRYLHMEKLTREMAEIFIRKVCVYKGKRIEIEWNFTLFFSA